MPSETIKMLRLHSIQQKGAYGVLLHHSMPKYNDIIKHLFDCIPSFRLEGLSNQYIEKEGNERQTIFDNKDLCFKLIFNQEHIDMYDNELSKVKQLYERLGRENFEKYTPYRLVDEKYCIIKGELAKDLTLDIYGHRKFRTTEHVYIIPCEFYTNDIWSLPIASRSEAQKKLFETVKYLNSRGIFHRDINEENVMVHKNELKLIDFGSCIIDVDKCSVQRQQEEVSQRSLLSSVFVHPVTYRYIHKFINKEDKVAIPHRVNIRNLKFNLYKKFEKDVLENLTGPKDNNDNLIKYLLHKNDCMSCAMLIYKRLQVSDDEQQGGFFGCFGKTNQVVDFDSDLLTHDKIKEGLRSFGNQSRGKKEEEDILFKLIRCDEEDFLNFTKEYRIEDVIEIELWNNSTQNAGRKLESKQYIVMRNNKKKYVVRLENKRKYIIAQKEKTYLSDIKGKYTYFK